MSSKYDQFWENQLTIISELIRQASSHETSTEYDVSDLLNYSNRQSWYGIVDISPDGLKNGEMVHAGSLGKQVISYNLLAPYPGRSFRFIISSDLKLIVKVIGNENSNPGVLNQEINSSNDDPQQCSKDLAGILSQIPTETWNSILMKEPEWSFMTGLLSKYDYGPLSVLMMASGLNDFKLKNKAEVGYWPKIGKILDKLPLPTSPQDLIAQLESFYQQELYSSLKIDRLRKFLRSHLADLIWIRPSVAVADKFQEVWQELARVMNQKPQDKTISFAMKCLGLCLIEAGYSNFNCANIPIPVDFRIIAFSKKIGLCSTESNEQIRQAWNSVIGYIMIHQPNVTMFHLDSLIWQISQMNDSDLLKYFQDLEIDQVGRELFNFIQANIIDHRTSSKTELVAAAANKPPLTRQEKIICFLPCCSRKDASGVIVQPVQKLAAQDLPSFWSSLLAGRKDMEYCIDVESKRTSAINLYTGSPYSTFAFQKELIFDLIRSGRLQIYILSAGYGVIDALEPINNYNAMMKSSVAQNWRKHNLAQIIGELICINEPAQVYGFFAGTQSWNPAASAYRFFFTEGVRSAIKQGAQVDAGCFYRASGYGVKAILGGIGNAFINLIESDFSRSFILRTEQQGMQIGDVKIGFDRISTYL